MAKEPETKRVGVLEVILLKKKDPDIIIEPCCSSRCSLKIPQCQGQDGLGHSMGNPREAMCYLRQKPIEIVLKSPEKGAEREAASAARRITEILAEYKAYTDNP